MSLYGAEAKRQKKLNEWFYFIVRFGHTVFLLACVQKYPSYEIHTLHVIATRCRSHLRETHVPKIHTTEGWKNNSRKKSDKTKDVQLFIGRQIGIRVKMYGYVL